MSHEYISWAAYSRQNEDMPTPQFYGVTTTGIYCRFGCPSRTPRPENVVYLNSTQDAQVHGLRPCKRCRPDQLIAPHQAFHEFVTTQLVILAQQHPAHTIKEHALALSISTRQLERIIFIQTGQSPRSYLNYVTSASSSERIST
ncbi:Ada metal-binding domain-containing protein [Aurantimicrobium sp. MWH-Uga1]|uniref:Ada metal-binding domain-containing protein n=1 Tax=Aurantimicrobium sp. MWH-Uga1 TaxID=2079575 RepID=UPI000DED4CA4|nr:Ada metal-binding domain-containing protein [Aurantimicrobium sp. MWH-Uga1]